MTADDAKFRDIVIDDWYRAGGGFHWMWPKIDVAKPADKRIRIALNRYPHNIIGAGCVVFGRWFGVRWKGSS